MPDSYPVLLKRGLAQLLHTEGIGLYKSAGSYTNAETTTLPGVMTNGPDLPITFDQTLVLTTLTPFDDGRWNRVTPVQIRSRVIGSRTTAENLSEVIRDALHGREQFVLGDLTFRIALQVSSLYITADEKQRVGFFQTIHFHGRKV